MVGCTGASLCSVSQYAAFTALATLTKIRANSERNLTFQPPSLSQEFAQGQQIRVMFQEGLLGGGIRTRIAGTEMWVGSQPFGELFVRGLGLGLEGQT